MTLSWWYYDFFFFFFSFPKNTIAASLVNCSYFYQVTGMASLCKQQLVKLWGTFVQSLLLLLSSGGNYLAPELKNCAVSCMQIKLCVSCFCFLFVCFFCGQLPSCLYCIMTKRPFYHPGCVKVFWYPTLALCKSAALILIQLSTVWDQKIKVGGGWS